MEFGLLFWLRVQILAVRFGLKVLSATLRGPLGCLKHPRVLGKFGVANDRAFKLPKMGAHGGCHGQGGAQTNRSSQSRQGAAREHRAGQEQPRSTRRSPGEPRSSHSNDTKMLQNSALVFAVSVTERCFFSLGPCSRLLVSILNDS